MGKLTNYKNLPYTTVYHLPALTEHKGVLVLIPGNPGLADFYVTYLDEIQKHRPELEAYAVSHAGFSTSEPLDATAPYYDLEYQIEHKCEFLLQLAEQSTHERLPVHLLSHSMGSYVLQNVVKRLTDHPGIDFKFIGLLFPTIIDIAESESGQLLTRIGAKLPITSAVTNFARFLNVVLPLSLSRRIVTSTVKRGSSQECYNNSIDACYKIFQSPRIIQQALRMSLEEMEQIRHDKPLQDWFFTVFLQKCHIWGAFAATDHWVSNNTRDLIINYKQKNVHFQIENSSSLITHSFCIDQSLEFAEITVKAMSGL